MAEHFSFLAAHLSHLSRRQQRRAAANKCVRPSARFLPTSPARARRRQLAGSRLWAPRGPGHTEEEGARQRPAAGPPSPVGAPVCAPTLARPVYNVSALPARPSFSSKIDFLQLHPLDMGWLGTGPGGVGKPAAGERTRADNKSWSRLFMAARPAAARNIRTRGGREKCDPVQIFARSALGIM